MMNRRAFLGGLALLAAPRAIEAQQAGKVARIGYLSVATSEGDKVLIAAFRQGLREHGYVEGKNLVLEVRHAAQRPERLPALAAELVSLKIDVAVVWGAPAILAIRKMHSSLPIVMTVHADPVGTGLVASLRRPGGQVTGLTDGHGDLAPKRLELLKTAVPSASRVAALLNPTVPQAQRQLDHLRHAAPALGLRLLVFEVTGPDDIARVFARAAREEADVVLIIPDPTWTSGQWARLADIAMKHRLPAIGTRSEQAEAGMLMSYGTNFTELWRRAATYVDKILKGANPGDLPIEHPTKFELVINVKTAKALGLTIPPSLLQRADQVIE
jgi:putative tryptophan/tyrosine transport system substrate-binding protein